MYVKVQNTKLDLSKLVAYRDAGISIVSYHVPVGGTSKLGSLISAAHELGMKVSVWLALGGDPYFVNRWKVSGYGMADFSKEDCRNAMVAFVEQLLRDFPGIDRLAFDYCRWVTTTDSKTFQETYSEYVRDVLTRCVAAAGDRITMQHVKAYKHDQERWCQPWVAEIIAPMCYHPDNRYGDFANHVAAWEDIVPRERIVPTLAVIETSTSDEPLKSLDAIAAEIEQFKRYGYTDLGWFDQRITPAMLELIAQMLPQPVSVLLQEAAALRERAQALRAIATADEAAATIIEAQAIR